MKWRMVVLVLLLGFATGNLFQIAIRPDPRPSAMLSTSAAVNVNVKEVLRAEQWRWATDKETYDVYVPTPCSYGGMTGTGCERGIAPWRLGPGNREKRGRDIEWVRVRSKRPFWHPARSDLELGKVVVFDGFKAYMAPVPAGGKNLGFIDWNEENFQVLLQWERDGIFPRIYGTGAPKWYVREKTRRGITVQPEHIVTPEEFNDPEYRKRMGR